MTLVEGLWDATIVMLESPTIHTAQLPDFGGDIEVCSVERHMNPHGVIFCNILGLAQFFGGDFSLAYGMTD